MHPTHIPLRATIGAFFLNSGVGKLTADEATAEYLHNAATTAYPVLKDIKPKDFARLLAVAEIGVGGALMLPMVSSGVAGAALTAFGSGLVGMYLLTPGMTEADGIRPTPQGIGLAKDSWLVAAGVTLMSQSALSSAASTAKKLRSRVEEKVSFSG